MAEKIDLYEAIEKFIQNKCSNVKNKNFIINYHPRNSINSNQDILQILYNNENSIPCLITQKEDSNNNSKDLTLLIKDSSFELVIYKNEKDLSIIKCIIILIVNDYSILEKEEANNFEKDKYKDINNEEEIINDLKLFLFNYIKENKNKDLKLDSILLGDSKNNIRFFNNGEIKNFNEEINKFKIFESNIKIKNSDNLNNILDKLNPAFKEDLMEKYLDEMPEEIANLMKKYKKINFNKEMYTEYINYKNNKDKDNENLRKNLQNEKENSKEKDNVNENKGNEISSNKKEKKESKNKEDKNGNATSDKKQLFKIK